jgi:serine/threonine protein kinase
MANDSEELTKLFDQYINTYKESGWCIDQQNLQIIRVLGNGASGTTYEGKYRDTKVAVKAYSAKILKEDFVSVRNEMELLAHLSHPNIVKFYGICFMTNPFAACLVTELAPNGELGKALYPKSGINIFSKLGQDIKFKIAIGVARGLQYLHSNKIVHRDVKPANVLLDEHHEPKLTDFGFSRLVDYSGKMTGETGLSCLMWLFSFDVGKRIIQVHGTRSDASPEILRKR